MTINHFSQHSLTYKNQTRALETDALLHRSKTSDMKELRRVCEDFESIFVRMMLDSMRSTLDSDGLIPKNSSEKLFEDRLFDNYAQKIGRIADLGVANMMYAQLSTSLPGSSIDIES